MNNEYEELEKLYNHIYSDMVALGHEHLGQMFMAAMTNYREKVKTVFGNEWQDAFVSFVRNRGPYRDDPRHMVFELRQAAMSFCLMAMECEGLMNTHLKNMRYH